MVLTYLLVLWGCAQSRHILPRKAERDTVTRILNNPHVPSSILNILPRKAERREQPPCAIFHLESEIGHASNPPAAIEMDLCGSECNGKMASNFRSRSWPSNARTVHRRGSMCHLISSFLYAIYSVLLCHGSRFCWYLIGYSYLFMLWLRQPQPRLNHVKKPLTLQGWAPLLKSTNGNSCILGLWAVRICNALMFCHLSPDSNCQPCSPSRTLISQTLQEPASNRKPNW